jgi:hypothetical protein
MHTVVRETRMRVSVRECFVEEKKRWETRSSSFCDRERHAERSITLVMLG